jgi:hypothetical protein
MFKFRALWSVRDGKGLIFQTLVQNIFDRAEYSEFMLKVYTEMCVGHHVNCSIIIQFSNKLQCLEYQFGSFQVLMCTVTENTFNKMFTFFIVFLQMCKKLGASLFICVYCC